LEIGDLFACFCEEEEEEESEGERKVPSKLLVEFSYGFIGEGRGEDEEAGKGRCNGEGCTDNGSIIWTGKSVFGNSCGEMMQRRHRSSEGSAFEDAVRKRLTLLHMRILRLWTQAKKGRQAAP